MAGGNIWKIMNYLTIFQDSFPIIVKSCFDKFIISSFTFYVKVAEGGRSRTRFYNESCLVE